MLNLLEASQTLRGLTVKSLGSGRVNGYERLSVMRGMGSPALRIDALAASFRSTNRMLDAPFIT